MTARLGKNKSFRSISATLAGLLAARFLFIFLHFSLTPHIINPENGHLEGLTEARGGEVGKETLGFDLLPPEKRETLERPQGLVFFDSRHCCFENCLTERYTHGPHFGRSNRPSQTESMTIAMGESGLLSGTPIWAVAPKNSPPTLI